jgi:hypothetical protein
MLDVAVPVYFIVTSSALANPANVANMTTDKKRKSLFIDVVVYLFLVLFCHKDTNFLLKGTKFLTIYLLLTKKDIERQCSVFKPGWQRKAA